MNYDLYNQQNDFGQLYMLGIEQILNGVNVDNTINALKLDYESYGFPIIKEYINTLEYCKKDKGVDFV